MYRKYILVLAGPAPEKPIIDDAPFFPSRPFRFVIGEVCRRSLDLFKSLAYSPAVDHPVKKQTIRTSLDVPAALHRRLHEAAARQGCSARQLILRSIERAVQEAAPARPRRRLHLEPPIVASTGKTFDLTNAQIYDLIEFP